MSIESTKCNKLEIIFMLLREIGLNLTLTRKEETYSLSLACESSVWLIDILATLEVIALLNVQ